MISAAQAELKKFQIQIHGVLTTFCHHLCRHHLCRRKATGNRKVLQDALQAMVAAQGTIDTE
jgi:hypothetical protein